MEIRFPSESILKPSVVSMTAVSLSLAAWSFPSFGVLRKGFDTAAQPTFEAFVILACWYGLIFLCFTLGESSGRLCNRSVAISREGLFALDSDFCYYSFTVLTVVGTVATLVKISQMLSWQQALLFMTVGEANELKGALYENYSIGLVSLRYVVLYSASIALYRIIRFRRFRVIHLLNLVLLAVSTVVLGSRLLFVATLLTTAVLLTYHRNFIRFRIVRTLALITLVFFVLAVVNFVRNQNYYEQNNLSFIGAGVSEIVTYLGSPFQVAIASAPASDQLVAGGDQTYRNLADEEMVLNTNSAFVHLHEQMGYLSWLYIGVVCIFMGFTFEFLRSLGATIFLLPCGAILYGSAELWRLDLFHQGIFVVLLVTGIGFPACLVASRRFFRFVFISG